MRHPTAEALYSAYNAHFPEAIGRLYSADAVHDDVPIGKTKIGRDEIVKGMAHFYQWFPDAHWETVDEIVDEVMIASSYVLTGTLQSEMFGVKGVGQKISIRGVHVLHLGEYGITKSEDFWDLATFMKQIGNTEKDV